VKPRGRDAELCVRSVSPDSTKTAATNEHRSSGASNWAERPCASDEGRCASVGGRAEECRSDQRNGSLREVTTRLASRCAGHDERLSI
jgi:hypothetical protein